MSKTLITDLKIINQKLWDIEDKIRDKERNKHLTIYRLAQKVTLPMMNVLALKNINKFWI